MPECHSELKVGQLVYAVVLEVHFRFCLAVLCLAYLKDGKHPNLVYVNAMLLEVYSLLLKRMLPINVENSMHQAMVQWINRP